MKLGTLCSGIGGIDLGFEKVGFECKFVVEIDKNCQNVLRRQYPNALMFSDMTTCGAHNLPTVDVLAGGTPCQGFSVAGLRGSLSDDRSNLCLQFCRIANELNPRILVWENVVGCLSTKDNAFGCFLAALVGADAPLVPPRTIQRWNKDKDGIEYFSWPNAGVVAGPKRTAAWRVLDSQYFGVAQRRARVFVVADTLGGCSPQILFECEGVRRHSPPRREAGQSTAGTLSARTEGGGGLGTDFELGGGCKQSELARPLLAKHNASHREDTDTLIAGTVSSKWAKGTGGPAGDECQNLVAIPDAVAFHENQRGEISVNDAAGALNSGGGKPGQGYTAVAIPIQNATRGKSQNGLGIWKPGDPSFTLDGASQAAVAFKPSHYTRDKDGAPSEVHPPLSADADKGDQEPVIAYRTSGNCGVTEQGDKTAALNTATDPSQNIVAFQTRIGRNGRGQPEPIVPALSGANAGATSDMRPCVASRTMVRRLTPTECARLQAHPDDWATWGLDSKGNRIEQSDSTQYRQYGNGVTATVLEWIAKRTVRYL